MSDNGTSRHRSSRRPQGGVITCPSCGRPVKPDSKWCPGCHFTGAHTLELFPTDPPPLLPLLDAAGILTDDAKRKITATRELLMRRFPQFKWRICTISIPAETSMPLFGFWLLNACPLDKDESEKDRRWTVLLLINADTGKAAVVPGYAAEPFLSDDEWKSILVGMTHAWQRGDAGRAIVQFLEDSRKQLARAWKRYGARNSPSPT